MRIVTVANFSKKWSKCFYTFNSKICQKWDMLNKKWRCFFLKLVHDQSKAANLSTKISDCQFPVSVRCRVLLRSRHWRQRPTGRTTTGQIFRGFADVQFEGVFLLFGSAASQWRPTPDHNLKKLYRFAI
jgi:hypothetical protein